MSEEQINSITVQDFYSFGSKRWKMKLAAGGEGLGKKITSNRVQKTGLALANFLECSTTERVQLLGNTEMLYLESLDKKTRRKRLNDLLQCNLACFVVTAGNKITKDVCEVFDEHKTPLFSCKLESVHIIDLITHFLDNLLAPSQTIHGDLLDIFGLGVLLVGDSGVGKSELALELIARGHRLVADDVVEIKLMENEALLGSCPEHIRYLMEVRGIGLIDIKDLFGVGAVRESKKIELIIDLQHWQEGTDYTRLGMSDITKDYLGIEIPCIVMPVAPGRNLSILLEVAARNQLLKLKGINVAKRVSRRLDRALRRKDKQASIKKVLIEGAGMFE